MSELASFAGFVGGVVVGVSATLILTAPINKYSRWLGRECWVRPISRPRWRRCVVVAVSWRGAICVRDCEHMSEDGYWIKKQNVPFRVTFKNPER